MTCQQNSLHACCAQLWDDATHSLAGGENNCIRSVKGKVKERKGKDMPVHQEFVIQY